MFCLSRKTLQRDKPREGERDIQRGGGGREREREKRGESDTVSRLVGMQPNFTASRMSGTAYGCNLCDSLCVSPHISVDIPSQLPYWSNIMSNTSSAWLHFQHNAASSAKKKNKNKNKPVTPQADYSPTLSTLYDPQLLRSDNVNLKRRNVPQNLRYNLKSEVWPRYLFPNRCETFGSEWMLMIQSGVGGWMVWKRNQHFFTLSHISVHMVKPSALVKKPQKHLYKHVNKITPLWR